MKPAESFGAGWVGDAIKQLRRSKPPTITVTSSVNANGADYDQDVVFRVE
jgi:hypothetical protein